jgi:hypothetical protein
MTDATGAPKASESTVDADARVDSAAKARRRLILAAGAALPSIFTLSSGAQTAAASTTVCLARQGAAPPRFVEDGDLARTSDGWLRAPVNFGQYDTTPANCVTSPQTSCVAFTPSSAKDASALPVPSAGGPVANAEDGSVWIVQGNHRMTSSVHTPITHVSLGKKHYGLVYVDQTGTVATLDPNGAPGLSPVTASCWASIMGGRISKLG